MKKLSANGRVIVQGTKDYEEKRQIFNKGIQRFPSVIVLCKTEQDVTEAVRFARQEDLEISVRAGGHHIAGTSVTHKGLMIDLSEMKEVRVDEKQKVAFVQGGATLGDVDQETQKYGLATPTGTVSETGIAGLALGGGLGYLRAKYGLTCDNIVAANVVTAEGELIRVSEEDYEDLFWAIRGGGGNFGIVTTFEFQLYQVGPEVLAIDVMYDYKDAKQVYQKLDEYLETAPNEVSLNTMMMTMPPAPFIPDFLHNRSVITLTGMYDGDPKEGEELIQSLRDLAEPIVDATAVIPYTKLQSKLDAMVPPAANFYGTSLYFNELSNGLLDELSTLLGHAAFPAMFQLWELHGKMNEKSEDENAYSVRDAKYVLLVDVMYEGGGQKEACVNWTEDLYNRLVRYSYNRASYMNGVEPHEDIIEQTYGDNFSRLQGIKRKYDPHNIFRMNHNIDPTKKKPVKE
ncbi:FAD-binding oxidoreductase [Pontibacillus marinus]|uniref:FAD-linked oxidase n=1 Tax=Pontibacillus marinus BH030004 = DSM 16465 TaxID=1385511 RepID=A0A0A5GB42_9BACI|nr:FAD-binding oxidoreductase [Pontibacillus marinus]KGX89259.1 FAD-linked oxidase [Pontibacillus marinus BH030004 = DSM 16465]